MFISLTLFRIQMSFLRLYIHISSSFFYLFFFINIIFKKSFFIYTQVSLEYLRHLVVVIFLFYLFVCTIYKLNNFCALQPPSPPLPPPPPPSGGNFENSSNKSKVRFIPLGHWLVRLNWLDFSRIAKNNIFFRNFL